jgi:proline iminopeptidase
MTLRHPLTPLLDEGMMPTADGHVIRWTLAGRPEGKPAVLLHGGPGSGSSPTHRAMFDPSKYLIVQFDQRSCGGSTPSATAPDVDLGTNTTPHLIADIEQLREALGIRRWLVWGRSWGTTLGLAYAQAHPSAVSELILSSVVTTTRAEVDWVTRSMGRIFPEAWTRFVAALPPGERAGDLAPAFHRLLMDPDPRVHEPAARAWCAWEDVHVSLAPGHRPDPRYDDPSFRLAFARLVTHYWAHAAFLDDGQLLGEAGRLTGIPVFLCHGRRDISAPVDVAVRLAEAIEGADLFIAEQDGHGGVAMNEWITAITDRLAA